ncbi:MAG TPA: DUF433 domain-containing protein [Chloroflexi bacterium]|nr:DUF433 domain-containing protein [Chloroflexota bacterium]
MLLEDYFDFLSPDDIRIKGTRVGIETVITDYLNGRFPKEIPNHYPSVTLEQVFATLTYYYQNKETVDVYIQGWRNHGEHAWQAQQRNPSPRIQAIQQMIREQKATYNISE